MVNANGQAVRGRDISSVARTSEGRYQVIFNGDVRGCALLRHGRRRERLGAAAAQPDHASARLASNVNGVAVRTENGGNGERSSTARST